MSASIPPPSSFDPARVSAGGGAPGPVFVSRSANARSKLDPVILASDGSDLPRLSDRGVRWILALAVFLQLFAWWRVDGYQLADSVEFMERARIFVRGEQMVDAGAIRPFGFSFVLTPYFAVADWFGMQEQRAVVWCIVLMQLAFACVLVWRCMRIGARLCGTSGALAAGFLVATNPVLLQYSTQPVSDIAASVCVAFALELCLERGTFARSLRAGLWLGLAFMVAYKTLLVSLAILLFVTLRDRFKHNAGWRGVAAGIALGLLVQSTVDEILYASFGASVWNYVVLNVGVPLVSNLMHARDFVRAHGLPGGNWLDDRAYELYGHVRALAGLDWPGTSDRSIRALQSPLYYVLYLPTILVWPAIGAAALGLVRAIIRPIWTTTLVASVFLASVYVMSHKGYKDFRLWLPLLPFLAPLAAWGWDGFVRVVLARLPAPRTTIMAVAAVATLVLSITTLSAINVRHFGGYWTAIEWVNARARETYAERRTATPTLGRQGEPEKLRVGSAYDWAVFERQSPLVEMVKLPWQLNSWKQYLDPENDHGELQRNQDLAALEELDLFLVHLPILAQFPDLMSWVDAHYEVAAAFYDQATYEELGPIFVLQRRTSARDARVFSRLVRNADAVAFVAERQLGPATDFVDPNNGERLQLLGVEYRQIPPERFGWITYHWRALTPLSRDYKWLDRITAPDERNVWENNHWPAYGTRPTTTWTPGDIVSESYLVVAAAEPFKPQGRYRPIGGAYRRGDLLPVRSWMRVDAYDPSTLTAEKPTLQIELSPARPLDAHPIRAEGRSGVDQTPDGIQFSADDAVRVFAFFLPVPKSARLADDGEPLPE